jgi:drug/metabolite transporter (DMT)-like permease
MIAGYILSLGSFFRLKHLLFGNPVPLVLNATVGNIIALTGSCFFSGPVTQYHKMMATPDRRLASYFYLGSLVVTLFVIIVFPHDRHFYGLVGLLLLVLMIVQYIAIFWYCLSYIPFAHDAVKGCLARRFR